MMRAVHDIRIHVDPETSYDISSQQIDMSCDVADRAIRDKVSENVSLGHHDFIIRIISSPDPDELSGKGIP